MKKVALVICTLLFNVYVCTAASLSLKGTVKDTAGKGIAGVNVTLLKQTSLSAITDEQGAFFIHGETDVSFVPSVYKSHFHFTISANKLVISPVFGNTSGRVEIFSNNGKKYATLQFIGNGANTGIMDLPELTSGLNVIRLTIGNETITRTLVSVDNSKCYVVSGNSSADNAENFTLRKSATIEDDTIIALKNGYTRGKVAITSYQKNDIVIVIQEDPFQPRNVIISEGFEGNNLDSVGFRKAYRGDDYGWMSITNKVGHNNSSYSLSSDSNNTGIRQLLTVDQFIKDSIAGLEFYLKATSAGQSNFYAAFGQGGNSAGMLPNGWQTVFGMGISKSDSLWYMYEKYSYPQADSDLVHRNFEELKLNKWYKCNIEYDFSKGKLNYYLDNSIVFSKTAPKRTIEECIVFRDTLGKQGPKDYYLDDFTVYKR